VQTAEKKRWCKLKHTLLTSLALSASDINEMHVADRTSSPSLERKAVLSVDLNCKIKALFQNLIRFGLI